MTEMPTMMMGEIAPAILNLATNALESQAHAQKYEETAR